MKKLLIFALLILLAFCAYAQEIDPELLKRAEAGDAEAQTKIGLAFVNAANYRKAFEWFTKATDQSYAPAQFGLGLIYHNGQGIKQDNKQAFEWYSKAANQNFAPAQHRLGYMYEHGFGVKHDYKQAFDWYTKAANQGFFRSQSSLGYLYAEGHGIAQDVVTGCAWMYISKDTQQGAWCDVKLTPNQMTRTLKLKDELSKSLTN